MVGVPLVSLEILIYTSAVLLLTVALYLYWHGQQKALAEKVARRMAESSGVITFTQPQLNQQTPPEILRVFWRAGIDITIAQFNTGLLCLAFFTVTAALLQGIAFAVSILLVIIIFFYVWVLRKARTRINLILIQLPLFLDQVVRAVSTGRSMESALTVAMEETPNPLREVIERVTRAHELGADLGDAIQEAADIYQINELYLFAMAIRINRVYGCSVRELLQNVIKMIHDRDISQRELKALTAETRFTAWVLALIPPAMALYMSYMNPSYLGNMWADPSGRLALIFGAALECSGVFIIWRMIKSI